MKTGKSFFQFECSTGSFWSLPASTNETTFKWRSLVQLFFTWMVAMLLCANATGQPKSQMVRLAKLQIDSSQLVKYTAALKEEILTSLRLEPGVLTLYAVSEKDHPTHITILEIYADTIAYNAHLLTPHFIKYKTGTAAMVRSLELVAAIPIVPNGKIK